MNPTYILNASPTYISNVTIIYPKKKKKKKILGTLFEG